MTLLLSAAILTYTYRDTLALGEPPTVEQVENVRAFAKLYSYVRYFHPSDAAAETDWDKFAIHGVRQVKDASNRSELHSDLQALLEPIAPTVQLYRTGDALPPPADVLTPPDTSGLQLVAWQHQGLGLQSDWPYHSIRLNRPTGSPSQDATGGDTSWSRPEGFPYAQASQRLDVGQFQGKQVRLRAAVRTADTESQGRLYLYVAGPGGRNDPVGDPVTSQSWSTTDRTVSAPSSASRLWIGVSVRAPYRPAFCVPDPAPERTSG